MLNQIISKPIFITGPLQTQCQLSRSFSSRVFLPARTILGHKMEVVRTKGQTRPQIRFPEKYPKHPAEQDRDLRLLTTYADMKLRWKYSTKWQRGFKIRRKWQPIRNDFPAPPPTSHFISHRAMKAPRSSKIPEEFLKRIRKLRSQNNMNQNQSQSLRTGSNQQQRGVSDGEFQSDSEGPNSQDSAHDKNLNDQSLNENQEDSNRDSKPKSSNSDIPAFHSGQKQSPAVLPDSWAIFKSSIYYQHKVTVGDLVQVEKMHRRQAGDTVVFGTVLMVGGRSFTILGKPTISYARVRCTVEQQTLCGEKLVFKYKNRRKQSRHGRRRQMVTMLRVDAIEVDPDHIDYQKEVVPKPDRLLDLWANRWLDEDEKELIPRNKKTGKVESSKLYDGSEHQKGTYQRRGLTESYRFYPDPGATQWLE